MQINCVQTLDQLDRLQPDWEAAYLADPQAQIFLSWNWIRSWFEITPYKWAVLTARIVERSNYFAFLPIIFRGFRPMQIINLGGQPLAPYTGFICAAENEFDVITSFAHYIQKHWNWVQFQMAEVLDTRLEIFLNSFSREHFNVDKSDGMPSLSIPLPDEWENYLQKSLSYNSRRKLLRRTRQLQGFPDFHEHKIQTDNNIEDIEKILNLWQQRWGPKPTTPWLRSIFQHFLQNDQLWSLILWDGETPIAGTISIVDCPKKVFYAYIFGGNPNYKKWTPGKVMCGYEIKYAIENGFEKYDFLVGADEYKFSFGAKQRNTFNIIITPKGFKSFCLNNILDIANQITSSIKKYLGKIKRLELVKWVWFKFFSRTK